MPFDEISFVNDFRQQPAVQVPTDDAPIQGLKGDNPPLRIVEFADFQCPACRSYYPLLLEVFEAYRDRISFVYRHFPLKQIHFNAEPAAWASEAASRQGKFWEMHNLLFEKQNEWSTPTDLKKTFGDYAELLGLDKQKFLTDLDSKEVTSS